MKVAAQIKNSKKQSKYVVNLSFDFPIESKKLSIDRPISGEFTISPTYPKKSMKIKLSSNKNNQEQQSRKLYQAMDYSRINSARNERKIATNRSSIKNSSNPTRHTKHLSCTHSKSPSRNNTTIRTHRQRQRQNIESEPFNIKTLKNQIMHSIEDQLFWNTNPSTQLKKQQQKVQFNNKIIQTNNINNAYMTRGPLMTPPLKQFKRSETEDAQLLSDIKRIQKSANQRKIQIGKQYMKSKILMQVSARKIQQAWRRYKTKQLIHAYSHSISVKLTNKMKCTWEEDHSLLNQQRKILNVKSCGYKNGKNQMKMKIKQSKQYIVPSVSQIDRSIETQQQLAKRIQIQQIKKWEQLIHQLRTNKDVQSALQKVQSEKQELSRSRQQLVQQKSLKQTIDKIENEEAKKHIQQTMQLLNRNLNINVNKSEDRQNLAKINTFVDHEDQKQQEQQIDQQQEQHQSISPQIKQFVQIKEPHEITKKVKHQFQSLFFQQQENNIKKNHEQNQTQSAKTEYKRDQNPKISDENIKQIKDVQKDQKKQQKQKQQQYITKIAQPPKLAFDSKTKPNIQLEQQQRTISSSSSLQQPQKQHYQHYFKIKLLVQYLNQLNEPQKLSKQQLADYITKIILTQLVVEYVHSICYHDRIKQCVNSRLKLKIDKAQGICTNMESIKDYLQNLISYIFGTAQLMQIEQDPDIFITRLSQPLGFTASQFLSYLRMDNNGRRQAEMKKQLEQTVIPKQIFMKHWLHAQQQIYFQRKHQDQKKEKQRVVRLKEITHIFFQSIFDGFNMCLAQEKIYGISGQPHPWDLRIGKQQQPIQNLQMAKPKIKSAFKTLTQFTSIYCGVLIEDKRTNLSKQLSEDIKQQRMSVFLDHEIKTTNYIWQSYTRQRTETLLQASGYVYEQILIEFCFELASLYPR